MLKSGCRIEDVAHETAARVRRAIAVNRVIAWRILLMTLLGRKTTGLPAEVLFSDVELQTLRAFAKKSLKPPVLLARRFGWSPKSAAISDGTAMPLPVIN